MQINLRRFLPFIPVVFSFFYWNCAKIDTTTLGGDLIPAVDNVSTFEDTLDINCTQGIFNDSTTLSRTEFHVLGSISNDPVFGKTFADLYLELKPNFYPFYFGNAGDTINPALDAKTGFDSVVLCLSLRSFYGDSTKPQHISVYQINNSTTNFVDSLYWLDFSPNGGLGTKIGEAEIIPSNLKNFTVFYPAGTRKDSVNNQIRIPITDASFLNLLTSAANRDTSEGANPNGIYRSDSLFKEHLKGLAVVTDPSKGNGLFYISLTDAKTRLEFHHKSANKNQHDTTYSAFYFSSGTTTPSSAHATNLQRNRSGAEYNPPQPATDVIYIQTTPGTYANLSIPELGTFQNSIIHRAEIFVEQVGPTNAIDDVLTPPLYLYLDLIDTTSGNPSKPIYYDLNPSVFYFPDNSSTFFPSSGVDFNYFGGYRRVKDEGAGALFYYNFNVTRYVQHIVTNDLHNYGMKLYAPYNLNYYGNTIPFNNNLAYGRIKVGSGNNANGNYRMKMRIVYSKI